MFIPCKQFFIVFLFLSTFSFSQNNKLIDSLKRQVKTLQDTILVDALDKISWEYKNINSDSAFIYARKALVESIKINNKKSIAHSYNTLGSNFENISSLDSALFYYDKSLNIKLALKDFNGIANSYNNIGIVYDEKGEYLKSLENYFKALEIYENHESSFDKVPMVLVNIGVVYKKQREYNKTLDYYKRALDIYKKNKYDVGIVITTGNIGSVLLELKKYHLSIDYSEKAKKLYSSLGYKRYVPYMDLQIAKARDSLKEFTEAEKLYFSSINQFKEDNNFLELTDAKLSLANNYYLRNLYSKSNNEALEVIKLIQKKDFKDLEIKALKLISKNYFKLQKYKEAYLYKVKFSSLKDSLFEKEKTKSIFELETKYQTEKKEKELLKTKAEKVTTELKLNNQKQLTYGLIGGLALLLLGGYSLVQRNKRKHQLAIAKEKEANLQSIVFAEEKERTKIARELHDGIVQQITAILLKSRSLFSQFQILEKPGSKELLKNIEDSSKELRAISHQMMPLALQEEGLIIALEDLFESTLKSTNIKYSFEHNNIKDRLPKNIEITLYRITQELISNILKHSKASEVSIFMYKKADHILYLLEDNGVGITSSKNKGIGLNNIRSRIDMIKGSVNFDSDAAQNGTLVTIKIPL